VPELDRTLDVGHGDPGMCDLANTDVHTIAGRNGSTETGLLVRFARHFVA
jgi:hypothetical protein